MARADVWIVFAVPRLSGAPAREGAGQKSPGRPVEISWKWLNLEHRAGRCTLAEFGEFVVALEQRETESNARLPHRALARERIIAEVEIARLLRATVRDLERRAKRGGKR
jgi:hypothetical protein